MTRTWFTADTHFGHAKAIEHSQRPFSDVREMDQELIARWNERVKPKDDVWHLGDFNFRGDTTTETYVRQLHGRIHIVWGNHDDAYARKSPHLFASVQDVKYLRHYGERLYLSHYAHRVWRGSHQGSWHLFGHSHGALANLNRSMDVGVDAQGYVPVSFEEIGAYMLTREPTPHHPEVVKP